MKQNKSVKTGDRFISCIAGLQKSFSGLFYGVHQVRKKTFNSKNSEIAIWNRLKDVETQC